MKEVLKILKQAGFSTATLAQALVAAVGFTVIARLATGLKLSSALPMLVGAFVLALIAVTAFKAIRDWSAGKDASDSPADSPEEEK